MSQGRRFSAALMLGAVIAGLSQAGAAIGSVGALQVRPGKASERKRLPRPHRTHMHDNKVRLQAAQAKRVRRQKRNLRWRARGAFGRR